MASLCQSHPAMSTIAQVNPINLLFTKASKVLAFPNISIRRSTICCTKLSQWEPSPVTYAPVDDAGNNFLGKTTSIFDSLNSEDVAEVPTVQTDTMNQSSTNPQLLKWPMWVLGPSVVLTTGMAPTLWLPLSSVFLGSNIVSLLSLIGLDCIFNIGASLFLLMADSCARPKSSAQTIKSKPPFSYKFWNMFATLTGFIIPLMMLFGSEKGLLQPQLPFISSAILLAPYFILLSVQMLTEMLTWHWKSPVWLVTPVVYEAYRILQLMRGLKLGPELNAPVWMMNTMRGLVSWWVLILAMQLMRVAWFAGFSAQARRQQSSTLTSTPPSG